MEEKIFKLKGKTLAIIDWANVYGWIEKLKCKINPQKLYDYLKSYPEIYDIRFYFGEEKGNKKSEQFQIDIKNFGYSLVSKKVKWVPDGSAYRRKCDFDVEITKDVLLNINNFGSLILFSGDGDYAVLVDELIKRGKQVIVVFARGYKGREYEDFKKGLYLCSVKKLKLYLKK